MPETLGRRVDEPADVLFLRDVGRNREDVTQRLLPDILRSRFEDHLVSRGDDDVGALGGEGLGHGFSEAPARARNERDFARETQIHGYRVLLREVT